MKLIEKLLLAVMMIASTAFLTYPVNAESGNITINNVNYITYSYGVVNIASTPDFTSLIVDSTNYNQIQQVFINLTGVGSFSTGGKSTSFTITSCGVGGGTAAYSQVATSVVWYFDSGSTVTCSPLELSYTTNIFADVTNLNGENVGGVDITHPVLVKTSTGRRWVGSYQVQLSYNVVNHYDISYQNGGINNQQLFTTSITKVGYASTNTKVIIQNITGSTVAYQIQGDSNTNNANFAVTNVYANGIALNMSVEGGQYTVLNVNTTGSGLPNLPPPVIINPITGVGIQFVQSSYALGDIANISWIRTISTPFGDTDYIVVINPNGTEDTIISSPPDTGYYKVLMSPSGTWKVEFRRSSLLFWVSVLDSDTAIVGAESPSYIYAPAQVASGKLFNVTYKIGFTQTALPWIKTYRWIGSDWAFEQAFSITGTKDVETNTSILVKNTGNYLIKLCDSLLGCKASTSTTSYFNGSESTLNITISNITIDKTAYSYGEYIATTVYVDNSNWSNKAISVDYLNYDTGITNNQQYVQNQVEPFNLYISDLVFPAPGNSALRLIGKNDTGTYVLAYKNFTLSSLDAEGYGLSVIGNQSCTGDTGQIKVVVPAGEVANLSISADNAIYNKDYVMNGSKIVPYTFKISGTYYITLRVSGEAKRLIIVNIKSCVVATPTTTPSVSGASNDIVNLFSQKIFWALIFIVGLALMVAKRERKG